MRVLDVIDGFPGDDVVSGLLLHAMQSGHVVLAVWTDPAPRPLEGRFQPTVPGGAAARRRTGGRTVPTGPGHVRLAMALPHRSALEGEPATLLRPEQAMNRCVRGLLDACRRLGADVSYPGRDVVTVSGRAIGWLALTEEADGGALFEAGLGVEEPLAAVPLAAVAPGARSAEAVAAAVVDAYRARPWAALERTEASALPAPGPSDLSWPIPPNARRVGSVATMLGTLALHVGVDDSFRLTIVRLTGDVIAPVATVCAVEEALVGVTPLRSQIEAVVAGAMSSPERWMLGIDPTRDVAAGIAEALR